MARRNTDDPTGVARNRKRGTRALTTRLNRAERDVKVLFRAVPKTSRRVTKIRNELEANQQDTVYTYDITPDGVDALSASVVFILNQQLLDSQTGMNPRWYWRDIIEAPYRQGAAEETVRFNKLVFDARRDGVLIRGVSPRQVPIEEVLLTPAYREGLNATFSESFASIKTLSERTSSQVMQKIRAGMQAGDSPAKIAESISERFDVSRSSAKRTADTVINKALNDGKIKSIDIMAEGTGLRAGVIHISALTSTTRASHAARHGLVFSTQDQQAWWSISPNRINCLCSVEMVLIDNRGRVVQKKFQEDIKAEKVFFSEPKEVVRAKPKAAPKKKTAKPKPKAKPRPKVAPVEPLQSTESIASIRAANPKPSADAKKVKKPRKPTVAEDKKLSSSDVPPEVPKKVKLSADESAYVEYYKGDGFYKSNEILRNQSAFDAGQVTDAKKMRNSINRAVKKSEITKDGALYRGIKDKDLFDNAEKLIGKEIPILTPQSTASNAGSATGWAGLVGNPKQGFFSADPGKSVVFKIRTKKGQHALNMESLSFGNTAEREMLLGSGGRYKVRGVKALRDPSGNITGKVIEVDYDE